jgi:hypothetical protein
VRHDLQSNGWADGRLFEFIGARSIVPTEPLFTNWLWVDAGPGTGDASPFSRLFF